MTVLGPAESRLPTVKGIVREVELARREIREGRFQRSMTVLTVFAAIVSGFEAYMQHLRGAFNHWLMWTPVALTVPTAVVAGVALFNPWVARSVLPAIAAVSLIDGMIGFIFHIRGIRRLPGGFKLGQYNIVMGPPIFAPLLLCTVGILGLVASFLRREQLGEHVKIWKSSPWSWQPPADRSGKRDRGQEGLETRLRDIKADIGRGEFQRGMAVVSAFLTALSGGEVYFEHLRGSFNQRLMWIPVWVTPPMVATALAAGRSRLIAHVVLPISSAITFLVGGLGFLLHLRGIKRMPGGISNLRFDITLGPPLFAPLLFTAAGLLGIIATLLQRRES